MLKYMAKIDEEGIAGAELNPDDPAEMQEFFQLLGVTKLGEKTLIKTEIRLLRSADRTGVTTCLLFAQPRRLPSLVTPCSTWIFT